MKLIRTKNALAGSSTLSCKVSAKPYPHRHEMDIFVRLQPYTESAGTAASTNCSLLYQRIMVTFLGMHRCLPVCVYGCIASPSGKLTTLWLPGELQAEAFALAS